MATVKKGKLGEASRGVATAASTHRAVYRVANGATLRAIVAGAIANAALTTGPQANGQVRLIAYVGEPTPDGAVTMTSLADVQGRVIADVHLGITVYGGAPSVVPLSWELNGGESVVVEMTNGVDSGGVAFDTNVSVNLIGDEHDNRRLLV